MGGIYTLLPGTYAVMWIGSLALAGIPFFAGYYSKDLIIEAAFAAGEGMGRYAYVMGMAAALLTAFYSWRLLFMTFHGRARADEKVMAHVHESPKVMMIPLLLLAVGAIFAGFFGYDMMVGEHRAEFWGDSIFVMPANDVIEAAHHVSALVKYSPVGLALIGILVAWWWYVKNPTIPGRVAGLHREAYLFLLNKWYFDELYDLVFVKPARWLGYLLWKGGDGKIIDGFGPDGISQAVINIARRAVALQTGYLYHYAFAMLIGVVGFVSWFFYAMGA